MLGSILTRQYRVATRGVHLTVQVAQQAIDVAGVVVGAVAGRLGLGNGHAGPEVVDGEFVPEAESRPEPAEPRPRPAAKPRPRPAAKPRPRPAAKPTPPEATATPPGATRMPPASTGTASSATDTPAPDTRAPEPPPAPRPTDLRAAAPPAPAAPPEPEAAPEPAHVSTEPELVEEFSEPGAEDGAGAQVRIAEPWPDYRHLKARDVVARLPSATREELAAVELFELAGANRKSVVVAAQRALKQASPPR